MVSDGASVQIVSLASNNQTIALCLIEWAGLGRTKDSRGRQGTVIRLVDL